MTKVKFAEKAFGAALTVSGLLVISTAATALPITVGSQNFGDVDTASSTTVDYGGSGIPTDPVAWSRFTDEDGNELILGLGTHGRYSNPDVTSPAPNVYGAVAGFNNLGKPSKAKATTWNFNWFVEVIPGTGSSAAVKDFGVELLYDLDPGAGTDDSDHGVITLSDFAASQNPTALVTQSSQNADFSWLQPGSTAPASLVTPPTTGFDPFAAGEYTFALRSNQGDVAIAINVVPVPAALPLLLTVFGGLGLAARYRRKVA